MVQPSLIPVISPNSIMRTSSIEKTGQINFSFYYSLRCIPKLFQYITDIDILIDMKELCDNSNRYVRKSQIDAAGALNHLRPIYQYPSPRTLRLVFYVHDQSLGKPSDSKKDILSFSINFWAFLSKVSQQPFRSNANAA